MCEWTASLLLLYKLSATALHGGLLSDEIHFESLAKLPLEGLYDYMIHVPIVALQK